MSDPLVEAKRRLRSRYLGREEIHGFGIRRTEGAVCVYLEPRTGKSQEELLEELQREAAPFDLVVVWEGRPKTT